MARRRDKQPPRTRKYYRSTKSGAGMTRAGIENIEEVILDLN